MLLWAGRTHGRAPDVHARLLLKEWHLLQTWESWEWLWPVGGMVASSVAKCSSSLLSVCCCHTSGGCHECSVQGLNPSMCEEAVKRRTILSHKHTCVLPATTHTHPPVCCVLVAVT